MSPRLQRTRQVIHSLRAVFLVLLALSGLASAAWSQEQRRVRVASYNIQFLRADLGADRLARLREVLTNLNADVIGLQEIDDRAALTQLFPPADWHVIIDDDSGDDQDVAVVVRKPLTVIGFDSGLDADDEHFLFPGSSSNQEFPNRRDLLFVKVGLPGQSDTFFVMVHHAKARSEGRNATDSRRVNASRRLVTMLRERFDDKDFVLLGDFNDNPDDRSLNILETGDPNAAGGAEESEGPYLLNLMEPLCAGDHVSHGRSSANIVGSRINTVDAGSRKRNNDLRGTDAHTGDILFDQLLIPAWMKSRHVAASARVFDHPAAMQGNSATRASDHLPVYADFLFGPAQTEPLEAPLRIVSLLPNPDGTDDNREEVTLVNLSGANISLTGWRLRDRGGDEYTLTGSIAAGGRMTIRLPTSGIRLNNGGDDVLLVNPEGQVRHQVTYAAIQAQSGQTVVFP